MQTMFLIALGFVSGSAIIAGSIYMGVNPPGIFRKPLFAAPIDQPDSKADGVVVAASGDNCSSESGGSGGDSNC